VEDDTIGVILNPAAAGGKTIKLLPLITETLDRSGRRHDIYVTSYAGETTGIGRQMLAQGHGTLVAIGGDGTINEVASAILESGEDATLGEKPGLSACKGHLRTMCEGILLKGDFVDGWADVQDGAVGHAAW